VCGGVNGQRGSSQAIGICRQLDFARVFAGLDNHLRQAVEHAAFGIGGADMQFKLAEIFGRPVDLVGRWAIERSRNPYRRNAILSTARPIYIEG
jgi:hypothetical protein